jgi:hypothetical protein
MKKFILLALIALFFIGLLGTVKAQGPSAMLKGGLNSSSIGLGWEGYDDGSTNMRIFGFYGAHYSFKDSRNSVKTHFGINMGLSLGYSEDYTVSINFYWPSAVDSEHWQEYGVYSLQFERRVIGNQHTMNIGFEVNPRHYASLFVAAVLNKNPAGGCAKRFF